MKISIPTQVRPMSQAAERRQKARERAAASRASAKVRADLDGAIADALASLVGEQGKGGVPVHHLSWKLVVEGAYEGLRERDYDKVDAIAMVKARLLPDMPDGSLVGVIEQL